MKHTRQEVISANKIKALLINGNVKEAIEYAKKYKIGAIDFGKIAKKN